MRLKKIILNNFRQFKGEQFIEFAGGTSGNVTVVYGENGRGKTGIFRALMYCLYGKRSLSQDELTKEKQREGLGLVNEIALGDEIGKDVQASVTMTFSHENSTYTLSRALKSLMKPGSEEILQAPADSVEFQEIDSQGNAHPPEKDNDKVTARIQDILNSRLRDYFLFDGERIERLTRNTKERRDEVRAGIRVLLDLDSMELALDGLGKVHTDFEKDIKFKATGKLQRVATEIHEFSNTIEDLKNNIETGKDEIKRYEHRIHKLSADIKANEECAMLEQKRQGFIKQRNDKVDSKSSLTSKMATYLNRSSHIVSEDLLIQLRQELDLLRNKGQLPPDIRKEFVLSFLENERCICGSSLDEESHAEKRNTLLDYIAKYYRPGLGKESLDLLLALNQACGFTSDLKDNFSGLLNANQVLDAEIDAFDQQIKGVGDELGEGGTTIDDFIKERSLLENELVKKIKQVDRDEQKLKTATINREELRKEAKVLEKQESHVKSLVTKRDLVKETEEEVQRIYDHYADMVRAKLANKSTEIFSRLADDDTLKDIKKISIDENYMLDVSNWSGQKRLGEISAGQRQIVSLSFIMALIQVAGNFEVPLFMDTPFGRLSGSHRDHLLETIPRLASQWILLVTDTEFTVVEAEALKKTSNWGGIYELKKEGEGVTKIICRDTLTFTPKRKSAYQEN